MEQTVAQPTIPRWLYFALPLTHAGLFAAYGGVMSILIPQQVAAVAGEAGKVTALGLVGGLGAAIAMLANPVAGWLSDRTRLRFGRRNTWILGGAATGAAMILLLSRGTSVTMIVVSWCLASVALNAMQAALTAVLPDRTPVGRRGVFSGLIGLATPVGMFGGIAIAGAGGSLTSGYFAIAGVVAFVGVLFTLTTRDLPPAQPQARAGRPSLAGARDFWWAFAGRFLLILGYFAVQGYLLYILQDYIGYERSHHAPAVGAVVVISGVSTLGTLLTVVAGGWLSDRVGRAKPFVFWSSALLAVPMLMLYLVPSWPMMLAAMTLSGMAFGVYLAVDTALITRVLPNPDDAARDLGILNIANAGPQVLAPLVASAVITNLGGYRSLFLFAIALSVAGAFCIRPIRSVR